MNERGELLRQILLRVVRQCPQCQGPFAEENVRLLGQIEETWLFSLHCRSCQTLSIVGLAVSPGAERRLEEEHDQVQAGPISSDDVLDMYLYLKDLDNFDNLFESPGPATSEELPR